MSGSLGSGLMSAFMDPGVNALLGAAQGFAQAAMPTRMPTPLGAVLGMGIGGALHGVKNSQQMQMEQQKLALGGMQNQLLGSQLPYQLAKNKMLAGLWANPAALNAALNGGPIGGVGATPGAAAAAAPGGTGGAPTPATGMTAAPEVPVSKVPLPPAQYVPLIKAAATKYGIPPEVLTAQIQQESGFDPNAPNGGLMQILPTTAVHPGFGMDGVAPSSLADPAANIDFGAQYLAARAKATGLKDWNDPQQRNAALTAYNGGGDPQYAQHVSQYLPQGFGSPAQGAGGATPVSASVDGTAGAPAPGGAPSTTPQAAQGMAIANQYEQQANQLQMQIGRAKFLGLPPPPGDPAALRTAAQQFRTMALAGPTALAQGMAKSTTTPVIDRFGNFYIGDGHGGFKYLGRGSEVKPVWNSKTGQMEYGDVGGLGIGGIPGEGKGGPQASAPPPMLNHFMNERGKDLAEQFNKIDADAASAKDSNYLFDNMRNDSKTWDMGKFADITGDATAWLSAAAQAAGIKAPGLDKPLSDYQAFRKSSGMLLRTAVHDVSSRAAVQEYNLIGDSLPSPTTSAQGFGQVADQWQGLNDFRIAKQKFAQAYQNHPNDFNVDFNSQVSPTAFMLNRMGQSPTGQQDLQTLTTRLSQTPTGRLSLRHMRSEYQFAKSHGLFDGLPAESAPAPPVVQQAAATPSQQGAAP